MIAMSLPLDATTSTESSADELMPTLARASESCSAEAVDRDKAIALTATVTLTVGARVVGLVVGDSVVGSVVGTVVGSVVGAEVGALVGTAVVGEPNLYAVYPWLADVHE